MGLIIAMLIALLNTLLNHTMLTRKKSVIFCLAAFVINSIIIMAAIIGVKQFITDIDIFKYIFCFIMFFYIVYIHLVFKETLPKKLFVMFSTWVISAIIYYISILLSLGSVRIIKEYCCLYEAKKIEGSSYCFSR